MNGLTLKLIAIITMLIDHATAVLVPEGTIYYWIGRSIGRLAFPIFCFLIVEGLLHTRDVKKYLIRLGAFAFISEVPFDLAFHNTFYYPEYQNVFFTLFFGLVAIYVLDYLEKSDKKFNLQTISILKALTIIIACGAAYFLKTDYSFFGIIQILIFYLFRTRKVTSAILVLLLNIFMNTLQGLAALSMIFIWFYNGERGPKFNKYVFYAFYPVHILILYLINYYIL